MGAPFGFGTRSRMHLDTCHDDLKAVCFEVIKFYDFSVIEGYRDESTQEKYFRMGVSHLHFPKSRHNQHPSCAVDLYPWPTGTADRDQMLLLAGIFLSTAHSMGVKIRWGGSWSSSNLVIKKERFVDLPHFELVL